MWNGFLFKEKKGFFVMGVFVGFFNYLFFILKDLLNSESYFIGYIK